MTATRRMKFGPFDFDLIVVDEAHRSVYNRFKRILEYFDAYVVGLTATPKSEIDHDTYALFEMEDKTPSFEYSLDEAVADGNLVPFKTARQDSLFLRRGMAYDELSPEEQLRGTRLIGVPTRTAGAWIRPVRFLRRKLTVTCLTRTPYARC